MTLRHLLIGLVAVLLTGCVDRLDTATLVGYKKIAVISAVGGKLDLMEIALTAFGNDLESGDIGSWGIDRHIVQQIDSDLQGHLQVVPVAYNPADFASDKFPTFSGLGLDYWSFLGDTIKNRIAATPAAKDVDAYLVVVPDGSTVESTNQVANGLGVVRRYAIVGHRYYLHALYQLIIVDGHSFRPMRQIEFATSFGGSAQIYGPNKVVDESYWASDFAALSPAARAKIRSDLLMLIDSSLPDYLQRSGLLR